MPKAVRSKLLTFLPNNSLPEGRFGLGRALLNLRVIFIALAVSSQTNAHLTSIMNEARLLNPIR